MNHILDNPIWNALETGNKHFALGNEQAKYMKRDVGFFAGLKHNSESDLHQLHHLVPAESLVVLFTPGAISIPAGWQVELKKEILQMVYEQQHQPVPESSGLTALNDQDVPAMLQLTELTKPGPFLTRTIELGNYEGVFDGNDLVAMAGQRLQPLPYTEISAVCTHPDHTGKGYAAKLMHSQIRKITAAAYVPFLHVYQDNMAACKLYEKLGFQTRAQMLVYVLKKNVAL